MKKILLLIILFAIYSCAKSRVVQGVESDPVMGGPWKHHYFTRAYSDGDLVKEWNDDVDSITPSLRKLREKQAYLFLKNFE